MSYLVLSILFLDTFASMKLTQEQIVEKLYTKGATLTSKQNRISLPILIRICKKMEQKLKFEAIWVSSDNIIIEGHHRYVASIITGYDLEIVSDYPKPTDLNVFSWADVKFTTEDWDTDVKIRMLNEKDALYNDLSVEEVENMLK